MSEEKISKKAVLRGQAEVEKRSKALERLKVEYVDIDAVKPNSYNPNRQDERDFELLQRSIREDGFTQPIVAHKQTNEIVDGEHRWRAARQLGMKSIPVVFVEMTVEQMKIATLRHNRARGSEDVELSSQLLRDLRELGALDWAAESLMLDEKALDRMLSDIPVPEQLAGEDFSEAWVPTRNAAAVQSASQAGHGGDAPERVDQSEAAVKHSAAFTAAMNAAPDNASKAKVEFEMRKGSYRVVVTFKDEEAALVQQALEPKPAQKLLELCQAKWAKMQQQESA